MKWCEWEPESEVSWIVFWEVLLPREAPMLHMREEEEGGKRGFEKEKRRKKNAVRNQERETKRGRGRQREAEGGTVQRETRQRWQREADCDTRARQLEVQA